MEELSFMVYLEGRAMPVLPEEAKTPAEALTKAREKANLPDAVHVATEVFKGHTLHEVIRG